MQVSAVDNTCNGVADIIPLVGVGEEAATDTELQGIHSKCTGCVAVPVVRNAVAIHIFVELHTLSVGEAGVGLKFLSYALAERAAALEVDIVG